MSEITWKGSPVRYEPLHADEARAIPVTAIVDALAEDLAWSQGEPAAAQIVNHIEGGHTLTGQIARSWCGLDDEQLRSVGKSDAVHSVVPELSLDVIAVAVVLAHLKSWNKP